MTKSLTITAKCDFGNRYVSSVVNELSSIESGVYVERMRGRTANAKSTIGFLSLGILEGEEIDVFIMNDNEDLLNRDLAKVKEILG